MKKVPVPSGMLRRQREFSNSEESVRKGGGSPLEVRSPWEMKRGVLSQEALLGVHRRSGVHQVLNRESSGSVRSVRVAERSPQGTQRSPQEESCS